MPVAVLRTGGRWVVAVAAALLLPAAAPQPKPVAIAATNWVQVMRATPQGGLLIGNPAAKVKLLEFGSFTCPTCARFEAVGVPALLRDYVAGGKVSFEFRGFPIHGPVDVGMTLLSMCQTPAVRMRFSKALFAAQDALIDGFQAIPETEIARLNALPPGTALVQYADAGGLDDFAAKFGVTKARFAQCISDPANNAKFEASAREAQERYKLTGTPWFVLNGKPLENTSNWIALEPKLREALQ